MRIGGRRNPPPAETAQERARRTTRSPVFGIAVITPLVFAGAVGGTPYIFPTNPSGPMAVRAAITPVAAVSPSGPDLSGPGVIVAQHPPTSFHVAAATISAPPPPMIVNAPGALGIPTIALSAYRNAEQKMAAAAPGCGVSWNLLAGIGRIESGHANGGAVDAHGTAVYPIYGPALDGTLPGNEVILQSSAGNGVTYARAMGPMQFLPGTWARYAVRRQRRRRGRPAEPVRLHAGGRPVPVQRRAEPARRERRHGRDPALQQLDALRPERAGLGRGVRHRRGPGRPAPDHRAAASARRRAPRAPGGLGPSLPMNINGLPMYDMGPQVPLIDLSPPTLANSAPMFPWMTPPAPQGSAPVTRMPGCTLICIGGSQRRARAAASRPTGQRAAAGGPAAGAPGATAARSAGAHRPSGHLRRRPRWRHPTSRSRRPRRHRPRAPPRLRRKPRQHRSRAASGQHRRRLLQPAELPPPAHAYTRQ